MGLPVRMTDTHYTYRDYRQWPDDERWELIHGVAYAMSGPSRDHQVISSNLHGNFWNHLRGKPCQVMAAPLDVFLPTLHQMDEDDVDTVVQPDLLVVCDTEKLRPNGIWGAPDLVVEILSPTTSRKDQHEKYALYERSGVKEYWVVDPIGRWLQQYLLDDKGRFAPEVTFETKGILVCRTLPGFSVEVESLWA